MRFGRFFLLISLSLVLPFLSFTNADPALAATLTTWTQVGSAQSWTALGCSANCDISYATINNGDIWQSINGGATWTDLISSGNKAWTSVATSNDGSTIIATVNGGYMFRSTDFGATWTQLTNAGSRAWKTAAVNSDGSVIAAGVTSGGIWVSVDSGATWTQQTSPGTSSSWQAMDLTDDSSVIVAANSTGGIWRGVGSAGNWSWTNITTGKSATDSTVISGMNWKSLVIDSTGTKVGVVSNDMYFTNDSGATWIHATGGNYSWVSIAGTSDLKSMMMVPSNNVNSNCRPHLVTTSNYTSFTDTYVGSVYPGYSAVGLAKDGSRSIATSISSYIYRTGDAVSASSSIAIAPVSTVYRTQITVTATVNPSTGGFVTFFANGKKIPGCIQVVATGSTATCNWRPSIHGQVQLSATFKPSDSSYLASRSATTSAPVSARSSIR